MKRIYTFIALLILAIIGLGIWLYATRSGYEVTVNLTPQQIAEYEEKIVYYDKKIKEVRPPEKPDIDFFIEKARYQEYLGKYGRAIDTLLEAFQYYQNTSAGWNNIAKLYEKAGDYRSAIKFYNKLIDTFSLNRYYLDVAWNYYRLGKLSIAKEAYGRYAQLTGQADKELFKLLYEQKK